jgi:hypothetical protein
MQAFIRNSVARPHSVHMRASGFYIAIVSMMFALPASADAMRCGSKLVRDGDTSSKVLALCGDPTDIRRTYILRPPLYDYEGRISYYGTGLVEVPVEFWTYNFGPYKLMRRIRIVDGEVEEIDTLGYGYRDDKRDTSASREALRDTYK